MTSKSYSICEIFDSVQGEGSWMGQSATFIRFSRCNLKCSWCDTQYSWNQGDQLSINAIISQIHYDHIILTGGEPALYDLEPLIHMLRKHKPNCHITIETNGTLKINANVDWVVVSPKPDADYIIRVEPDELKYVVDQKFNIQAIPEKYRFQIPIWLQPNAQNLQESMKKCYKLVMTYPYLRLGVQLHKFYDIS
jgi:organic radical activating enzyme